MAPEVHLEINAAGSWRRVLTVDRKWYDDGDLEHEAHDLLSLSADKKTRARIIEPGQTAPLATWNWRDGWRDYEPPSSRRDA